MIELIPFTILLAKALQPKQHTLYKKLKEIKSKTDPSIGSSLNIKSIDDIKQIVSSITYRPDILDKVQTPYEVIQLKVGDCEDFSVLTYSLLKYLGYNPGIAISFNQGDPEAHAFTYVLINDKYYIFSNKDFFEASSVEEAANMLGFTNVIYEKVPDSKLEKIKEVEYH